jgi:hypothetical protein
MKYIITESQYKTLTEEKEDFETFLLKKFPNIDKLQMRRFNKFGQGLGRKYYDPETNEWLFRLTVKSAPSWEEGKGVVSSNPFNRLNVTQPLYTYIKKYGMNFEYKMLDWFNKTYDENADSVLRGGKTDR